MTNEAQNSIEGLQESVGDSKFGARNGHTQKRTQLNVPISNTLITPSGYETRTTTCLKGKEGWSNLPVSARLHVRKFYNRERLCRLRTTAKSVRALALFWVPEHLGSRVRSFGKPTVKKCPTRSGKHHIQTFIRFWKENKSFTSFFHSPFQLTFASQVRR